MQYIGLILGLAKLALEIFKDERGDRFSRMNEELLEVEKEYQDELSRGDDDVSDLALAELRNKANAISSRILEAAKSR